MKRKVVSGKSLPLKFPVSFILAWALFLDRVHAPEWAWAVSVTIIVLYLIVVACLMIQQDYVELFKGEKKGGG